MNQFRKRKLIYRVSRKYDDMALPWVDVYSDGSFELSEIPGRPKDAEEEEYLREALAIRAQDQEDFGCHCTCYNSRYPEAFNTLILLLNDEGMVATWSGNEEAELESNTIIEYFGKGERWIFNPDIIP